MQILLFGFSDGIGTAGGEMQENLSVSFFGHFGINLIVSDQKAKCGALFGEGGGAKDAFFY